MWPVSDRCDNVLALTGLSVGLSAATRGKVSFRGQPISPGKVFAAAQNVAAGAVPNEDETAVAEDEEGVSSAA